MMTPQARRDLAQKALNSVLAGGRAGDFETQLVDFKEENGSRGSGGAIVQIGTKNESSASTLAKAAACMSNTDDGGVLIVGVADALSGVSALVGAQSDADWLKGRILALTQPGLVVEIEEVMEHGKRLLFLNVPPSIREIHFNGKLQTRIGAACLELTGEMALSFLQGRRNFDWSAQPSGMRLSQAEAEAIAVARRLYKATKGSAPESGRELISRLGVFCDEKSDPELTRAGALLLCKYEPSSDQLHLMITNVEGVPSRLNERGPAPILPLFESVMRFLLTEAFPAKIEIVGTQRRELRSVPESALRESIVNALMHREYKLASSVVVATATGSPSEVLKVVSPGGLPPGVTIENIISTSSIPRNRNMAVALRALGLAEGEGVGIDTMYREMLKEGHPAPEIAEQGVCLVVRLVGGSPDTKILHFYNELGLRDPNLPENISAILAINHLLTRPTIRVEDLSATAQCLLGDALYALEKLEAASAVERLLNRSLTFRLTQSSKVQLGDRISYPQRSPLESHSELIVSYLDSHAEISRDEAMEVLGLSGTQTSVILKKIVAQGKIDYVGAKRGGTVRYKKK